MVLNRAEIALYQVKLNFKSTQIPFIMNISYGKLFFWDILVISR